MEPILEETVIRQVRVLSVPFSSVEKGEQLDEFELTGHEICHPCCLSTLLTLDPDAHVGCSYHVYVICTIAHCQRQRCRFLFEDLYDLFFIGWSAAIADGLVGRQQFRNDFFGIEQEYFFSSNFIEFFYFQLPAMVVA